MPVENGSAWVRPLIEKFQKVYARVPKAFDEDPMEAFKRCIYVHPFHEEDPIGLVKLIGADNVLFGSDFPHPEGMYDPISFVDQLDGPPDDDKAKVMGGNLNRIMKVAGLSRVTPRNLLLLLLLFTPPTLSLRPAGAKALSRSMHSTVSAGIVS